MENMRFNVFSDKCIRNANKSAHRLMEELNKINISYVDYRKIYFSFLEIYCIIFSEENIDADMTLRKIENSLFMKEYTNYFHAKTDNPISNCFWNIIVTSNTNGDLCNIEEFMKFIRKKYGQDTSLTMFFCYIIKNLYPYYKEEKFKSYKFEFVCDKTLHTIYFEAKLSKKEIEGILNEIKVHGRYFKDIFILYLNQHHLEYLNFKYFTEKSDYIKVNNIHNSLLSNYEYNDYIGKIDNYYLIINDTYFEHQNIYYFSVIAKRELNEDYSFNYHIMSQEHTDYEDWEENSNFIIKKSDCNAFSLKTLCNEDKLIVPWSFHTITELLLNIDIIESATDVETLIYQNK